MKLQAFKEKLRDRARERAWDCCGRFYVRQVQDKVWMPIANRVFLPVAHRICRGFGGGPF